MSKIITHIAYQKASPFRTRPPDRIQVADSSYNPSGSDRQNILERWDKKKNLGVEELSYINLLSEASSDSTLALNLIPIQKG